MIYQTYIDRNGNMKKKVLRNCDRFERERRRMKTAGEETAK